MRYIFVLLSFAPLLSFAQSIFTYTDFNRFVRAFNNGYFSQIEHNEVSNMTLGDEFVAYMNVQKDFKVYNGIQTKLITNQFVNYKMSDHMLAWNIGQLLYYYENGKPYNVTSFGGKYALGDSLIVYQDLRYYTLNVIYKGKTIQLMQQTSDMYMPELVGDNVVVFRDNGNYYKLFWRGEIYDIGVWNGNQPFQFAAGTDIVAFNDPNTRTFAVFQNGEFLDVEDMHVSKMKACRGFVIYEDIQGNLNYYGNGKQQELASFFQYWDAKDDVVLWGDANYTYTLVDGVKTIVTPYALKEWKIKNDVIAYKTNINGVGACIAGRSKVLTTLASAEYLVNGHAVMAILPNRSVIVYYNDNLYND